MKEGEDEGARKGAWMLAGLLVAWRMISKKPAKARGAASAAAAAGNAEEAKGRDKDRTIERVTPGRERWGTMLVTLGLLVGVAGGVGFLFIYWTDGSNMLLGGNLALCFLGFGTALVFWSHLLMRHEEATDPREELPSPEPEREKAEESFDLGAQDIKRRKLLKVLVAAGVGMFAAMFVSLLRSFGKAPNDELFEIVWKKGQRLMTLDGQPVNVKTLPTGSSITVFPEGSVGDERAQTVLIHVNEQLLRLPEGRAQWAPKGYVAYSRVCTHAGCPVGLFESKQNLLLCPCHQSTFDVLRGAQPTGGPAARPLPQLPLYADGDGTLRAGGRFSATPGPGFWWMQ
ncbi:MAG: Rieske 2Fe-2S domain-containing protein [Acidobacteriaceae bacterium]